MDDYSKQMQKHIRKQKLRDARRKSGPRTHMKKPRLKKISPRGFDDWDDFDDIENMESVMPKGDRERRREIEKKAFRSSSDRNLGVVTDSIDTESVFEFAPSASALVVEVSSGMCRVDLNGEILLCSVRGSLKSQETRYINVVAVGDQVVVSTNGNGQGVVESVLPRRSVLPRPYSPDKGVRSSLKQIVVANVDRLLIVASWREPFIWPAIIDRYLITAERNNIEAVICINKIDLIEDRDEFEKLVETYSILGYRLIMTSAISGEGINELRSLIKGGMSVLAGLSGVGKSSLLTKVDPNLNLKVGHVSERGLFTGQGRHTTTQSSLWKLANGGIVIDTPGVRSFGIAGISPLDLSSWYSEMKDHAKKCRFSNCTHMIEPDCGVKSAVKVGLISDIRYKNYTQIFDELSIT
jgi:ribosome biogenesis GTPase